MSVPPSYMNQANILQLCVSWNIFPLWYRLVIVLLSLTLSFFILRKSQVKALFNLQLMFLSFIGGVYSASLYQPYGYY